MQHTTFVDPLLSSISNKNSLGQLNIMPRMENVTNWLESCGFYKEPKQIQNCSEKLHAILA